MLRKHAGVAGLAGACAQTLAFALESQPTLPAIILSRPFDLPPWLTPIINMLLPFVDGSSLVSKIAVAALDSFWRSHRELLF
jgi:hypothetical protein